MTPFMHRHVEVEVVVEVVEEYMVFRPLSSSLVLTCDAPHVLLLGCCLSYAVLRGAYLLMPVVSVLGDKSLFHFELFVDQNLQSFSSALCTCVLSGALLSLIKTAV